MKRVFRLFPPRRQSVKEKQIAECYGRSPEGHVIVRLRLNSPTDMLMPFEGIPANFGHDTDDQSSPVLNLNKDFVDYLFARLAEVGDESLLLRVNVLSDPSEHLPPLSSANALHTVIQRYFSYLEDVRRQNLKKLVWDATLLSLLGAAALGVSAFLDVQTSDIDAGIGLLLLGQGVTVFGWLTLWEALANMLWHWRPLYQQLRMCQRLKLAQLELVPHGCGVKQLI
ncbi:MAG: hypothetical protein VKL39_01205 [Leptolyngbyaceae bacterium]|nr:hypothetical protein [Leptolyngbyaceae bacterium]